MKGLPSILKCRPDQRAFDHPYFEDLKWKWSLRLGMVRSIESLEAARQAGDMDATDYRYAWAWVHFMMHGPEAAHQVLVHDIACYQQSTPPGKLSVELADAVPNPTEKMIQHFKHWQQMKPLRRSLNHEICTVTTASNLSALTGKLLSIFLKNSRHR